MMSDEVPRPKVIEDLYQMPVRPVRSCMVPWIDEALQSVPVHNVNFYTYHHEEWPPPFGGRAGFDNDKTYSVTVCDYWIDKEHPAVEPYMKWVLKHELRHCKPQKNSKTMIMGALPFRHHDIYLKDIGFDPPGNVGFFWEDFQEIKCCDDLMNLFSNIEGIEEYLE